MKLGRNDPCQCGSGKKYKRCCYDRDRETASLIRQAMPIVAANQDAAAATSARLRDEFGVHINYVHPVPWQGRKVWAIGSRVYLDRPPNETFHEFILHVLRDELGEAWHEQQRGLRGQQRHFVSKCLEEWTAFTEQHTEPDALVAPGVYTAEPNGWVLYLLALAWDVATLIHTSSLPTKLMARLRNHHEFQGARYEVAVAALFARLDFEIEFLDELESLGGDKRVEFVATHRPTGQPIAVEAKSRRRTGVLNEPGERNVNPLANDTRAVKHLFKKALQKAPESTPFMIFIDINAPVSDTGVDVAWEKDLRTSLKDLSPLSAEGPPAYNAFHVTNFASHYAEDSIGRRTEGVSRIPTSPQVPLKALRLHDELRVAISNYGRIPAFGEDGTLLD